MQKQSVWRGALAGLFAGLAASWVMNQVQAALSSVERNIGNGQQNGSGGQQDEPATTKAAERISQSAFGHELTTAEKKFAEPVVHYAMGGLSGATYGAAEQVTSLAAAGAGALFGTVLWLAADEIAVPVFRLSKKPTEYPPQVHLNSLAAHVTYGVATHFLSRELMQLRQANTSAIRKAVIIGVVTGLRSMTGPCLVSRGARQGWVQLRGTPFELLGSPTAANTLTALAVGEWIADKLPQIPARIEPTPLAIRAVSGGLCGAALFSAADNALTAGALIGAVSAIGGSFAGYYARRALVARGVPDLVCALSEDAVAAGSGIASLSASV